jgi:hypothetical protein
VWRRRLPVVAAAGAGAASERRNVGGGLYRGSALGFHCDAGHQLAGLGPLGCGRALCRRNVFGRGLGPVLLLCICCSSAALLFFKALREW